MSREIRVSIDDDEVFERMKRRKQELDLSWEDVLHRGLQRREDRDQSGSGFERPAPGPGAGQAGEAGGGPTGPNWGPGPGQEAPWDRFADSVEEQVQHRVYNALRNTFGAAGIDVPEPPAGPGMDREMADLSNAEDAVLTFGFLDDDPAFQVPLRVNLETSADGLAVEVVAVRQGKSVRHMNTFDARTRQAVTTRLAEGVPAALRFGDGVEDYAVEPVLRWGRDDAGRPTVTDVSIEAVRLDGADAA